ncbi:DUF5610 domain-containing protein [Colwelliaceae bacterium 6441]
MMQIQPNNQANPILSKNPTVENEPAKESAFQQTKKMKNLAILSAHTDNSVANNPMNLLYKTAIEEINKELEPVLGENATQAAYDAELDVSPEATADRIIKGALAFHDAFKEQNSDLSEEESLTKFMTIISDGIDKGFADAKDILDSLSVLEGNIGTNIDTTYDLVQLGLANFKEQSLTNLANKQSQNDDTSEKQT